jgi:fructose-1,6-bisphosphatase/sedoheptulose 1,7-bisphosphatase-like protein
MGQQGDLRLDPDRNLALELVRATEAAAMAAARHLGRGDKELVDQAAVDAMRPVFNSMAMRGVVVIGEGEKDNAPMLYNGEQLGTGVDVAVGIGGTPEGVITACALKCLGGALFGRLWPRNDQERRVSLDAGYEVDRVLVIDDLVRGDNVFFAATGATDGELLRGVRFEHHEVLTQSLSMRSRSSAVRLIDTRHQLGKSNLVAWKR